MIVFVWIKNSILSQLSFESHDNSFWFNLIEKSALLTQWNWIGRWKWDKREFFGWNFSIVVNRNLKKRKWNVKLKKISQIWLIWNEKNIIWQMYISCKWISHRACFSAHDKCNILLALIKKSFDKRKSIRSGGNLLIKKNYLYLYFWTNLKPEASVDFFVCTSQFEWKSNIWKHLNLYFMVS